MKKIISPLTIIIVALILRLLPHPPNIAPITAIALFGGVYLNKKYALVVPLIAMVCSDFIIGFHSTILYVYGSFFITGLLGLWLKNHKSILSVALTTLASSILFYLITNFGVWMQGFLYSKTLQGLLTCYYYAIPFFRNTLIGDLMYVAFFFVTYELFYKIFKTRIVKSGH